MRGNLTVPVTIIIAAFAGCLDAAPIEPAATDDAAATAAGATEALLTQPTTVAEYSTATGAVLEFSTCGMGEGPPAKRTGELVANGTRALRITVEAGATTAVRAGAALDDGDTTWTAVVPAGQTGVFEIEVGPDGWESTKERWTFYYQPNLPAPATQACYTGASVGGIQVTFEAVP